MSFVPNNIREFLEFKNKLSDIPKIINKISHLIIDTEEIYQLLDEHF